MFRPTSPQLGLFSVGNRLDETKRARLKQSWAHQFRNACQKTLHNYRALLLEDGEGSGLFESMTAGLIAAAGLNTRRQRQDSIGAEERGTDLRAPIGSKGPSEETANIGDFDFDETRTAVLYCPMGQAPVAHERPGKLTILAIFSAEQCDACPLADKCPVERRGDRLVFPFRIADVAVAQRRQEQATPEFKEQHKVRSGIEATNSELKRCHGFGKLRVRSRPRVALAVHLKVIALNVKRYVGHLAQAATAALDPSPTCTC
jgi:hypothetical protein